MTRHARQDPTPRPEAQAQAQTIGPTLPLPLERPLPWLGGYSAKQFMRRFWQKKPLLVRNAFSSWAHNVNTLPVSISTVRGQAIKDRLPSRLVNEAYQVVSGPLRPRQMPSMKTPAWTVLVQQFNTVDSAADRFLDHFRFLPEGRLDDLMISIAGDRGGIGAHVDSYDVFLIQAQGQRKWEIANTFDPSLQQGLDLKILKRFKPEQTMLLGPGDLLYLPPGVAHRGTAVGADCMTYSVGFRAPQAAEVADMAFGQYLDEKAQQPLWSDPWLEATSHCGRLPDRLVLGLTQQALACMPTRQEVAQEVVVALSAPHPSVFYDTPAPLSMRGFLGLIKVKKSLRLSPGTRLLLWNDFIAINGESVDLPSTSAMVRKRLWKSLEQLANTRVLEGSVLNKITPDDPLWEILWQWHSQGFLLVFPPAQNKPV